MISTPYSTYRRRALGLALAGLASFCAPLAAQTADPAPISGSDSDARVLPVWSHSSGRVEALLLLDPVDPSLSGNPLDRVLTPNAPRLGLGARLPLSGGSQLQASLQLETDGLALLCDDRHGLSRALGSLGEHCLLATLGREDPLLSANTQGTRVGLDWRSTGTDVDLSFGLSWLRFEAQPQVWLGGALTASPLTDSGQDSLDLISAWAQRFESQHLRLNSLINLGPQARLLLGGDVGRNRMQTFAGNEVQWESAALSLGLGYGDFSGQLTGRLIELPQGGSPLSSLDIGLSWRMPWRGQLSVGAKNVLGTDASHWPLAELPASEDPSARVPYVRYQQDL